MTDENNRPQSIVELDKHELACRIAEACIGVARPDGMSVIDAMNYFDEPENFYRAAEAAAEYILECVQNRKGVH